MQTKKPEAIAQATSVALYFFMVCGMLYTLGGFKPLDWADLTFCTLITVAWSIKNSLIWISGR